jgi:glycosyltransferase involved in cell wall biosynthesis
VSNEAYDNCREPTITVIITLFNYAEYIQECLDSVAKSSIQGLPQGFDVIVIDDGSSDNSVDLVEQYIRYSPVPICLVKKFFNTGLADARNLGLRLARSPFVFILDADNWIYSNCLSVLYDSIVQSGCAATYGIINCFDNDTRQGIGLMSFYEWDVRELVEMPYIDAMALFKKDILLQVGGYSTELMEIGWCGWEDYDLWLKLAQRGYDCRLVPQILSAYRVHGHSMIKTTNAYTPVLANYFKKKFSSLIEQFDGLNQLFCFPCNGEDAQPDSSQTLQMELQAKKEQLKNLRAKLKLTQENLEIVQQRIVAMETSKFWKLRKVWFKIKQILHLPSNE